MVLSPNIAADNTNVVCFKLLLFFKGDMGFGEHPPLGCRSSSFPFLSFSKPLFKAAATALAIATFFVGRPSSSANTSSSPLWTGCDLCLVIISHYAFSEDKEQSLSWCSALSVMVVSLEGPAFSVIPFISLPLDTG